MISEPTAVALDLNEYRNKIYPRVFLMDEMQVMCAEADPALDFPLHTEWLKDLAIGYVIDRGDKFTFISKRHLGEEPAIAEAQIKQVAIANFVRDFKFTPMQTIFGCYGLHGASDHCATVMFVEPVWQQLVGQLGKDLVVAVPAYDLLFFTPADDEEGITNLKFELYKIQGMGIEKRIRDYLFLYKRESKEWSFLEDLGEADEWDD